MYVCMCMHLCVIFLSTYFFHLCLPFFLYPSSHVILYLVAVCTEHRCPTTHALSFTLISPFISFYHLFSFFLFSFPQLHTSTISIIFTLSSPLLISSPISLILGHRLCHNFSFSSHVISSHLISTCLRTIPIVNRL